MFDLDPGKLILVGAVALVVVGPKELPRVLRQAGRALERWRSLQADFHKAANAFIATADLDSVDRELNSLGGNFNMKLALNPATAMRGHSSVSVAKSEPKAFEYASAEMAAYLSPEVPEVHEAADQAPAVADRGLSPPIQVADHARIEVRAADITRMARQASVDASAVAGDLNA